MPEYFELLPSDGGQEICLFSEDDARGRLVLRPEYVALACEHCGKLDEERALREIGVPELSIRSNRDFLGTEDEFVVVGNRFKNACEALALNGLDFLAVPGGNGWFVVLPTISMKVDLSAAGFEYHGQPCRRCGRARESSVGPLIASIAKPDDPMSVFTGDAWSESITGRRLHLFCTGTAARGLRQHGLDGLELLEAL